MWFTLCHLEGKLLSCVLPSDAGFHDRVVIQELLKQVAQVQSLETSHREFKGDSYNFNFEG